MQILLIPRKEMKAAAKEAARQGHEVRILEAENPHHGRILRVMKAETKHVVLIVR